MPDYLELILEIIPIVALLCFLGFFLYLGFAEHYYFSKVKKHRIWCMSAASLSTFSAIDIINTYAISGYRITFEDGTLFSELLSEFRNSLSLTSFVSNKNLAKLKHEEYFILAFKDYLNTICNDWFKYDTKLGTLSSKEVKKGELYEYYKLNEKGFLYNKTYMNTLLYASNISFESIRSPSELRSTANFVKTIIDNGEISFYTYKN